MKAREANKGAPSADLLVCFPSRAHLTLLPKPICSPARPADSSKHHHNHRHNHQYHHHRRKSSNGGGGGGQASPLLWTKNKQMGTEIVEPTSPKVTCAGQIKVRHKAAACKSWQSVMKEIERIHNGKHKKKSSWMDSLGFKKDIMQFLRCLRNIRLDFRCLRSISQSDITTDDEGEGEECENHSGAGASDANETSRTVFSKWFMVLQENQNNEICKEKRTDKDKDKEKSCSDESTATPSVPPPNALLLTRWRSSSTKSWLEEKAEEQEEDVKTEESKKILKALMEEEEEERNTKKENLVVMRHDTDFYEISSDIAKEKWVVGGTRDPLSRSRSWKRW